MPNLFFHKKDLESQLDFFKKFRSQDNNIGRWIISTSTLLVATIISLVIVNTNMDEIYDQLESEHEKLNTDFVGIRENSKSYKNLKQQNLTLKNKQSKFDQNSQEKNSFLATLQKTSESIEDQTWLEKISFDPGFTSSFQPSPKGYGGHSG